MREYRLKVLFTTLAGLFALTLPYADAHSSDIDIDQVPQTAVPVLAAKPSIETHLPVNPNDPEWRYIKKVNNLLLTCMARAYKPSTIPVPYGHDFVYDSNGVLLNTAPRSFTATSSTPAAALVTVYINSHGQIVKASDARGVNDVFINNPSFRPIYKAAHEGVKECNPLPPMDNPDKKRVVMINVRFNPNDPIPVN